MKILLVDDEPIAFSEMTRLLSQVPGYHIIGYAKNGLEAIQKVVDLRPDIVMLDIRMPQCGGLRAAREINRMQSPPGIVFVSASRKYTLEALDLHAAGYLLKPVRLERLRDTLSHIARKSRRATSSYVAEQPAGYVCCRTSAGLRMVDIAQVPYLQAKNKYTELVYAGGHLLSTKPLVYFERQYGDILVRARRDVLINRTHILGLNRISREHYVVVLKNVPHPIRISRRNNSQVRAALNELLPSDKLPTQLLAKSSAKLLTNLPVKLPAEVSVEPPKKPSAKPPKAPSTKPPKEK